MIQRFMNHHHLSSRGLHHIKLLMPNTLKPAPVLRQPHPNRLDPDHVRRTSGKTVVEGYRRGWVEEAAVGVDVLGVEGVEHAGEPGSGGWREGVGLDGAVEG